MGDDGGMTTKPRKPTKLIPVHPDASSRLGIGRSTAYDLVQRGEFPLPVVKVGNQYRVSEAALDRLCDPDDAS